MDLVMVRPGVVCESFVMLFQVVGVAGLLLSRLTPSIEWAGRGKWILILALVGLGLAGAMCGQTRSGFALLAGGTMTVLLVGMIAGTHPADPRPTTGPGRVVEPTISV